MFAIFKNQTKYMAYLFYQKNYYDYACKLVEN